MNRAIVVKRVLRSLCANTPEEEIQSLENYRSTNVESMEFSGVEKNLFDLINKFYNSSSLGSAPSITTLLGISDRNLDTNLSSYIKEVGIETHYFGSNYRNLLEILLEVVIGDELTSVLTLISQIYKEGVKSGFGKSQTVEKGVKDALNHGSIELARLRRKLEPNQQPMGNQEAARVLREQYVARSSNPVLAYGLTTGISTIDDVTRGGQNKELWLLAGLTGHNKSTFMLNWVRHLITNGDYCVVYYSLEMRREQVWAILACSHSCDPKFNREPLLYDEIKSGTMSHENNSFYLNELIPDLEKSLGHVEVFNPKGRTTIDDITTQVEITNRNRPVDMLVIDYLGMLASPRGIKGLSKTDRIGENITRAKNLATDFDNGNGVFVTSPHQINRAGAKVAKDTNGVFDLSCIADSSDAERASDNLFTIYQDPVLKQKKEAVITHLKARDSRVIEPFNIYLPPEHRFVGELAQVDESQLSKLLDA